MSKEELDLEELREITGGFIFGETVVSLFEIGASFTSRFRPATEYGITPYPPGAPESSSE